MRITAGLAILATLIGLLLFEMAAMGASIAASAHTAPTCRTAMFRE